ncbi:hypothetical protein GGX14DRAFT_567336 [Mycena pura]|uniref:Uncharacterized protein n=1 Tax=Mycena pura TaxID=153505 RepID=A0AAD6VF56_9AGAR|nr:hypothetical protein GGX14DRAFT_567336 [Mycena pura]
MGHVLVRNVHLSLPNVGWLQPQGPPPRHARPSRRPSPRATFSLRRSCTTKVSATASACIAPHAAHARNTHRAWGAHDRHLPLPLVACRPPPLHTLHRPRGAHARHLLSPLIACRPPPLHTSHRALHVHCPLNAHAPGRQCSWPPPAAAACRTLPPSLVVRRPCTRRTTCSTTHYPLHAHALRRVVLMPATCHLPLAPCARRSLGRCSVEVVYDIAHTARNANPVHTSDTDFDISALVFLHGATRISVERAPAVVWTTQLF